MQETHPTQPVQPLQQVQQAVQPVVKKFPKFNLKGNLPLVLGVVLVILAGVGTGWLLSGRGGGSGGQTAPGAQSGPKEAGLADESTFKEFWKRGELTEKEPITWFVQAGPPRMST